MASLSTSTMGFLLYPLSDESCRNIGRSNASQTLSRESAIPLSSAIVEKHRNQVLQQSQPVVETTSSLRVPPEPLFLSLSLPSSALAAAQVQTAQPQIQYVCRGSLALGTYSRKPIIPARNSMHPDSHQQLSSNPHHSGSVMKDVDATSRYFDSSSSTAAIGNHHGTETRHRQGGAAGITTSSGEGGSPSLGINSRSGHSAAFLTSALSFQNPESFLGLGGCPQPNESWLFTNPSGAGVEAHHHSSKHCAGETQENLSIPETSQSASHLLSFLNSNFPEQESLSQTSQDFNQAGETLQKQPPSFGIDPSTSLLEPWRTPAVSCSTFPTSVKNERPEVYTDQKLFDYTTLENIANELLKDKGVSQAQLREEKSYLSPPSPRSNYSSQFSSPSLSSSSTSNSRSPCYSPCHSSIELNTSSKTSFRHNSSSTLLATYFKNQNGGYLGLPAGPISLGVDTNSSNLILPNDEQLGLDYFYPFQHHILYQRQPPLQQQQLQLQQFWPQAQQQQDSSWLPQTVRHQLPENTPFINAHHFSDAGSSAQLQPPPALKPMFFCPKCGKGHTRHSNLLAHLRETHSQVKKVFCDVPGCKKSYKRISECRRHKKSLHGIPLPSELRGKVRKPRSTFSPHFRASNPL